MINAIGEVEDEFPKLKAMIDRLIFFKIVGRARGRSSCRCTVSVGARIGGLKKSRRSKDSLNVKSGRG